MTVCIAAICNIGGKQGILGALDRMVTTGDLIEFEPPKTKIAELTPTGSVIALIAGDTSSQISICQNTIDRINNEKLSTVKDIAEAFSDEFSKFRLKKSEFETLKPIGLTVEAFIEKITKTENSDCKVLEQLCYQLGNYRIGAETIVCGVDDTGAHLYLVGDAQSVNVHPNCQDNAGFIAIGSGGFHAASQFMFFKYADWWPLEEALFLTYAAKKHAEVSPGVGAVTDMFVINPNSPPSARHLNQTTGEADPVLVKLKAIYDENKKKKEKIDVESYGEVRKFIKALTDASKQPPTPPPNPNDQ